VTIVADEGRQSKYDRRCTSARTTYGSKWPLTTRVARATSRSG